MKIRELAVAMLAVVVLTIGLTGCSDMQQTSVSSSDSLAFWILSS